MPLFEEIADPDVPLNAVRRASVPFALDPVPPSVTAVARLPVAPPAPAPVPLSGTGTVIAPVA